MLSRPMAVCPDGQEESNQFGAVQMSGWKIDKDLVEHASAPQIQGTNQLEVCQAGSRPVEAPRPKQVISLRTNE